jgi:DNA-binding response OmpR family regulator
VNDDFRILFVDDEETFLYSTADLLRREGFACDCASDAADAARCLAKSSYQLLIADIRMPGNADLEFVNSLASIAQGLSIILVTGHPSLASALQCIELPVVAYLVKPFNFHDLLSKVQAVAQFASVQCMVRRELYRLEEHRQGLRHAETSMQHVPRATYAQSWHALVTITLGNIVDALANLNHIVDQGDGPSPNDAGAQRVPALPGDLREVLHETVATLERTKNSFKSKELRDLRKRLEGLLNP